MTRKNRYGTDCVKFDTLEENFGRKDILPMWIADMDYPAPSCVIKALKKRINHPIFGYSLHSDCFFTAIERWIRERHNWAIEKDWLVCTPGIVPAINIAVLTLTDPGDEIVIQPPVYPPFFDAVDSHQRKIIENPLRYDGQKYVMDYDDLESKITDRTKMIVLCNPHNPVGRVFTQEELIHLGEICMRHNIIIVSDEIHADLTFESHTHYPIASLRKEFEDITVTCMAPSKTFNIAGLATSEIIIPNEDLREPFKHLAKSLHICSGNLMGSVALVAAYCHGESWLDKTLLKIRRNVDYVLSFLDRDLPQVKLVDPDGTFLLWLDFRELNMSQQDLKQFMVDKAKLGLNDGAMFGESGTGFMRMNVGCSLSMVKKAMKQLKEAVDTL